MFNVYTTGQGVLKVSADSWEHVIWDNKQGDTLVHGFEFFLEGAQVAFFNANQVLGIAKN